MTWQVRVRPRAELELYAAATWYEAQRAALGTRFLDEVTAVLASLRTDALHYAEVQSNVRRVLTRRFPYGVYYQVSDDRVVVLTVLHQRRQPWTPRGGI